MICFFHTLAKRQAMVCLFMHFFILTIGVVDSSNADQINQFDTIFDFNETKNEEVVFCINHSGSQLSFKRGFDFVFPQLEKKKKSNKPEEFSSN